MKPLQYIPLGLNFVLAISYLVNWSPGKFMYWLGATILTLGIIHMEG